MSSIQKISGFSKAILAFSLLLLAGQIVSIFFTSKDVAVGHIAFQIFENLLMIIVVFLPVNIGRKTSMVIPRSMEIAFVGFCFASLVMGDLFDFYGKFPFWSDARNNRIYYYKQVIVQHRTCHILGVMLCTRRRSDVGNLGVCN